MSASLDGFLLELRDTKRISNTEYLRAYSDGPPLSEGLVAVSSPVSRRQLQVVHRVFNIVELLELILNRLSPAQQLSARGVCRGFREVIERSPNMALRGFRRRGHTEILSLPPFNIRGIQLSLTKARGMSGVSVVLDLGVQSKHYKRILRKSRTLRKTLIARPAPSRARLSADCGCAVSRSWLFENKAGVTFGDVFNAVDALGSHRCETCLSKYYVRVRSAYGGS
jgi:hypothetical protein